MGGNVCGVFPSRRLLILEATVGRRRGMTFEELVVRDRGAPLFTDRLTNFTQDDERGEVVA